MHYEQATFDRFAFLNCHRRRSECKIEALQASHGRVAVIATELRDNPGMSITNAAEYVATAVCQALNIDPRLLVWIEHYGYPSAITPQFPRTYDLVTFARFGPHGSIPMFFEPSWRVLRDADWLALGLTPRLPEPAMS